VAALIALEPDATEFQGDYAEALVRAEGGFVGPDAVTGFETLLAQIPDDPRALYYLALRDAQNGDSLKAAQGWARILQTAPADAPYTAAIREILDAVIEDANLDRAALDIPAEPAPTALRGPSAEDVAAAAAMPGDQQMQMIRGMVAQLEARLEEEPGDIEGWLRLARSRKVLGEPEAGVAALERALATNPGDPNLQSALVDLRAEIAQ
jgi:cytochrome c-type biogenesis protein CcmH